MPSLRMLLEGKTVGRQITYVCEILCIYSFIQYWVIFLNCTLWTLKKYHLCPWKDFKDSALKFKRVSLYLQVISRAPRCFPKYGLQWPDWGALVKLHLEEAFTDFLLLKRFLSFSKRCPSFMQYMYVYRSWCSPLFFIFEKRQPPLIQVIQLTRVMNDANKVNDHLRKKGRTRNFTACFLSLSFICTCCATHMHCITVIRMLKLIFYVMCILSL